MKLDRKFCLGGHFNNKEITGIKIDGYVIYPWFIDKDCIITYVVNKSTDKDPTITGSIINYEMKETINDEGLIVREINFENISDEPVKISFKGSNVLRIERLKGSYDFDKFDGCFYNCDDLTYINLSEIDTSKATSMQSMFSLCTSLTSLDLSSFNTEYIIGSALGFGMSGMFYGCKNLTSLDLSNFYTSKIKDMSQMFIYCEHLTSLDLSTWNTSNVVLMSQIFDTCSRLPELNLSSWNTSNVTTMHMMFYRCSSLKTLNLSNFDMINVTDTDHMLASCSALRELRLDNCNHDTIYKIIDSYGFPTGTINGETRKLYCREENTTGLIAPNGWEFVYTNETVLDVLYDEPTEALLVPESMTEAIDERLTISQATYDPDNENLNI